MSSIPPQTPETLDYAASPQDVKRGMAIAALVCGLLGLLSFCPIFIVLALLGIIFGIIALVRAANHPGRHTGRGMAIAGICCGGVGLLIMPAMSLAILLPSLSRAREITKRAVCTSNLKGIGTGMLVYANDNLAWLPISPFAQIQSPDPVNATRVGFVGQMSANLTSPDLGAGTAVHPSRSLFLLVTDGTCSTRQFVCPSTDDADDDLMNYSGGAPRAAQPGVDRFDFRGYSYLSYGYHVPFGTRARLDSAQLDPRMVIAAEKGPYFQAGTPIAAEQRVPDAPIGQPGANVTVAGAKSEAQVLAMSEDAWRPYNSRNHNGEGQNMLHGDGSVLFRKKPIVDVNLDNIYTMQSGCTTLDTLLGQQPADFYGPLTNTDSAIVP